MRYHYKSQLNARQRRHLRVRAKVSGTPERPRLIVFRSSADIYAQRIDDSRGVTLTAASSLDAALAERVSANKAAVAQTESAGEASSKPAETPDTGNSNSHSNGPTKTDKARAVGQMVGERALALGITSVVFDRGGFRYHGRVKAVAEGAREAGLIF
jgi:large subunit ribosomal protein L18